MSLASRAFVRIRAARILLLTFAVVLALVVVATIWSRRPPQRPAPAAPPGSAGSEGTLQALEKFRFTSTVSGKRAWTIVADRLLGVSEGVHTLDKIREIELVRPDGKVLHGSADHGSYTEGHATAAGSAGGAPAQGGEGGRVVLEGNARIEGSEGEELRSERLEYDAAAQKVLSPGRCTFRYRATGEGKGHALPLEGEAGRIEYDLAAKSASLDGDVVLRLHDPGAPETVLRAAHAELSLDIAVATFTGGLTVARGEDRLAAPGGRVERGATGAGRLDAGPGAKARLTRPGGAPSTLAEADRITIEEGPAAPGKSKGRIVTLAGNALVEEEAAAPAAASPGAPAAPSAARPPGPASGRRLGADTITMVEGEARAPRPVHAEGRVTLRMPAAQGETSPRTMTCAVLDGALEPDGRLRSADAKGGVAIRAGARTATSASARFIGETRVELRGSRPRVEEASRTLVANEIDLARGAGDEAESSGESLVTARGAVRARFTPRTESSGGPFAPGEPVETSSDQAEFRDGARTALFTGKVVARQAERALSAARLLLNDAERTATAEGAVGLRTFRREALPSGAPAGAPAPASRTAAAKPIPVHINAEALFHDDRARTTRFEGHAVYREPGRTLAADRITMVGGPDAEASKTAAEGHVAFDGDGKKGEGDRASYDAGARTITLTGTEQPARVTETATGRTWRGPSLTWSLAPDSIPVASGESGRSTISAPEPAGKSRTRVRSTDGRIAH